MNREIEELVEESHLWVKVHTLNNLGCLVIDEQPSLTYIPTYLSIPNGKWKVAV